MKLHFCRSLVLGLQAVVVVVGLAWGLVGGTRLMAGEAVSLAGDWRFAMDRQDAGVKEQWFGRDLPDKIQLPGSLETQGYGDAISVQTPWVLSLYDHFWYLRAEYAAYTNAGSVKVPFIAQPARHYLGAAWYQRDLEIPAQWQGRHLSLFLERPHWESTVWVDDQKVGVENSLCAPHEFELGLLAVGHHRLTIRVDNRLILPYRLDAHSVSDSLDDAWNGIVGKLELRATAPVWISDLQLYPHVASKSVTVRGKISNLTGHAATGRLQMNILDGVNAPPATQTNLAVAWGASGGEFETELDLGWARAWDEFHPNLYRLEAGLVPANTESTAQAATTDAVKTRFGLREFKASGQAFTINGEPVYLRGTHSGGDFPLTGYPPTDVAAWKKLFRTCQTWGLNHMRFHSWCPPEEAFVAADELGFYLHVECGMWNEFRPDGEMVKMLYLETERIIHAYGNHPSFVMLSASNEAHGRWQQCLPQWVEHYRVADPRRLYTPDTGWLVIQRPGPVTGADYIVAGRIGESRIRGESGWFGNDYSRSLQGVNVPAIAHELGQWCAYPDYSVMDKFTGFARPGNYEIFRASAARHGVLAHNQQFAWASGRLQLACYKEEIEANLRTPGLAAFQLLDLHDYLGQGTALVGVLDAFWETKDYASPAEFTEFCNRVVPLARLKQRVFSTGETLQADCEIANFSGGSLENARPGWQILDPAGQAVASGEWPVRTIPQGKNLALGKISADLARLTAPQAYQLVVRLAGTGITNHWNFWLYPATLATPTPPEVLVTRSWAEAQTRLAAGGKVLLLPRPVDLAWNSPPLSRLPVFWNAQMGPTWNRFLGLYCQTNHPALAEFPTGPDAGWQWTEVLHNPRAMNLASLPDGLEPIVSAIDDWNRNYKLALAFECRVGTGKLLTCTVDFNDLDTHPVARQLYHSLLDYMGSGAFQPVAEVSPAQLDPLWFDTRIMRQLHATVAADGEPAAELADGDPNTFWASAAGGQAPHAITVDFPQPEPIRGLVLMPRQNQREHQGDIQTYRIATSEDGIIWVETSRGTLPSSFDPHPIDFGKTIRVRHLKLTALAGFGNDPSMALAEVAVDYAGLPLAGDDGTIEYQRVRTASPDIDAGGGLEVKPKH